MHMAMHSHGHWPGHNHSMPPNRGERLVARHDQNDDGRLSAAELEGTRLGKRLSVDRFARLDGNGDGMLEAGELGRARPGGAEGPSVLERVMIARFADHLAEAPDEGSLGEDIAEAVIARLDRDGSGALNSEEIAGTRLADKIGAGFYDLDADRNGALDMAELGAFVEREFLGVTFGEEPADPGTVPDDPAGEPAAGEATAAAFAPADAVDEAAGPPDAALAPVPDDAATVAQPALDASPAAEYAEQIRASFEAALQMLRDGADARSAHDVVQALYGEVKTILGDA